VRLLALGGVAFSLFGAGFLAACGSSEHGAKSTSLRPPGTSLPTDYTIRTIYEGP
jgi:hypothetical protein